MSPPPFRIPRSKRAEQVHRDKARYRRHGKHKDTGTNDTQGILDQTLIESIIRIGQKTAREAGKLLLDEFGLVESVTRKKDGSFVSDADVTSEKHIIARIQSAFPGHAIFSEEQGRIGTDQTFLWIIDPLDGTHNYIRGIDVFGVNIALLYENEFVAGFIYLPVTDEMYHAFRGQGAHKNGCPIHISARTSLADCSLAFDSSISDPRGERIELLRLLGREVFNIRMVGSTARILSWLAEGVLDAAVEFDDKPYDFGAGVCLLR